MIDNPQLTPEYLTRVQQCGERLVTAGPEEKTRVAAELSRLGVWSRGSSRPRGSLERSAQNRLPSSLAERSIIAALVAARVDVRCEVALALGEWGGEQSAEALSAMLRSDSEEEVQLHAIAALRLVGGPLATAALLEIAAHGSEDTRHSAIAAIGDLATGGPVDESEPPDPLVHGSTESVALKTRGKRTVSGAAGVISALSAIREDTTASSALRLRVNGVLGFFTRSAF